MNRINATICTILVALFCLLQGSSLVIGWNKYLLLGMRIVYVMLITFVCAAWGATLITEDKNKKKVK